MQIENAADYQAHVRATRAKFYPPRPMTRAQMDAIPKKSGKFSVSPLTHWHLEEFPKAPWYWDDISGLPAPVRAKAIKNRVADRWDLAVEDLEGPGRAAWLVRARWEAIAGVRNINPQWSLPQIAAVFGNRDHTTILHALRKQGLAANRPNKSLRPVVWRLHCEGRDIVEISQMVNRTRVHVRQCLARAQMAHERGEL